MDTSSRRTAREPGCGGALRIIQAFNTGIQAFIALRSRGLAVDGIYVAALRSLVAIILTIAKQVVVIGALRAGAAGAIGVHRTWIAGFGSSGTKARRASSAGACNRAS